MKKYSKISNREKEGLLQDFCEAISVLNNPREIMDFITDLLTEQEVVMIAKRIKIAKMLIEGKEYKEIQDLLKTSPITVSKINQWLLESGEGFRVITQRTKKEKPKKINYGVEEFNRAKKRYPIAFWPQLLIEDIVKTMNHRQKERVRNAIKKIDHKSQTYRSVSKFLK